MQAVAMSHYGSYLFRHATACSKGQSFLNINNTVVGNRTTVDELGNGPRLQHCRNLSR
jgi:hypothetical protein